MPGQSQGKVSIGFTHQDGAMRGNRFEARLKGPHRPVGTDAPAQSEANEGGREGEG